MGRRFFQAQATSHEQDVFAISLAAYILFSLLDCFTTAVALASGRAIERNPFAAAIYGSHGILGLYFLKFAVLALIIIGMRVIPRGVAAWLATAFTAVVALAVASNLGVLFNA